MAPTVIPPLGKLPNVQSDTEAAFKVLRAGGTVIGPVGLGYCIFSIGAEAVDRAFAIKQRREGHTMGVFGTCKTQRALHDLPEDTFAMCRVMSEDMGSHFVVLAKYRPDAPLLAALDAPTLARITRGDTLGVAIVAPETPFLHRLCELCDGAGVLLVGSSANLSGSGNKYRVSDIEPELRAAADLVVDHGLQRFYTYAPRASCILDVQSMKCLRVGVGYNLLRDRLYRFFGVELEESPVDKTEFGLERREDYV
jgi:tRNA A37 threonylcarbamoyladenosine synthetase subunit TsaC/SUA5/YrdC